MADGIDLVLADHRRLEALFADALDTHDAATIGEVLDVLTAHDDAEHAALYPLAGHLLDDADLVARSTLAHSAVKKQVEHLRALEGPALVAAFDGLHVLVSEHMADEEATLLPALRAAATAAQLDGLAARFLQAKQRVG